MKRRITCHDMGDMGIASHMKRRGRGSGRAVLLIAIVTLIVIAFFATRVSGMTTAPAEMNERVFISQIVQPLPTALSSTGVIEATAVAR